MTQWSSIADFMSMGGYAVYVWSSFGLTLMLLIFEVVELQVRRKKTIQQAKQAQAKIQQRVNVK